MSKYNIWIVIFMLLSMRTFANEVPMTSSPIHYEFELSKEKKDMLIRQTALVKVGDSLEKVKNILGSPSVEQRSGSKDGKFIVKILQYNIRKVNVRGVNIYHDQVIIFFFSEDGHLTQFHAEPPGLLDRHF